MDTEQLYKYIQEQKNIAFSELNYVKLNKLAIALEILIEFHNTEIIKKM